MGLDVVTLSLAKKGTGGSDTASRLTTPRTINEVPFDGTKSITIEDKTKEPKFEKNTAFNKNFGIGNDDVARGDHDHDKIYVKKEDLRNSSVSIDDIVPSRSKIYSSKRTEDIIEQSIGNIVNTIENMEGFSDNNFTDYEKMKLARIEDNANYFTLTNVSASIVTETSTRKFITPTEKEKYSDKYTKSEIDNLISNISSGLVRKPDVPTFDDIAATYPNPIKDWCVSTSNGDTYLFDGNIWFRIGSGTIPAATNTFNGLMSASDKDKLDNIQSQANNYTHPTTHDASMINENNDRQFVTAAQKTAINNINTTIDSKLTPYRKKQDKIIESDIDLVFLKKLETAGGTLLNDDLVSEDQVWSSDKTYEVINNTKDDILDIFDDVAQNSDIDNLFSLIFI